MAGPSSVSSILSGIISDAESSRKLAAYHLQTLVADPSFARAFVKALGVPALKTMVLEENGNSLAYALGSLTRLLEMDLGWDYLSPDVMERAVQLVVTRPVINVLRNALLLLVLVVSRPFDHAKPDDSKPPKNRFGFKALVPLLQVHTNFLDCLVDKLNSADHALCANALHLLNALMRDSVVNGGEDEWPKFVARLQEMGVISGVESLMRGDALHEVAGPVLEFQDLMKTLLARWSVIRIDMEKAEHRNALKQLHSSSFRSSHPPGSSHESNTQRPRLKSTDSKDQEQDKWDRLGFTPDNPAGDLEESGFLGMMDLTGYIHRNLDMFQRELLEQSVLPVEQRCPIAKASLSVTMILYEFFDIMDLETEDTNTSNRPNRKDDAERYVQPLLLRWERMHAACLNAFIRLWKETGALIKDYRKIEDLTSLLVRTVLGQADRKADVYQVEHQLNNIPLEEIRRWQLQEVEQIYDYAWNRDLRQLREQTHKDALVFLREQRIRVLLKGSWFPVISSSMFQSRHSAIVSDSQTQVVAWRFVRLSNDRKYLHHVSHPNKLDRSLAQNEMSERIDLDAVSSVDSSVSRSNVVISDNPSGVGSTDDDRQTAPTGTITRLTIYGSTYVSEETVLLELNTGSVSLGSEWLDGLLMLLNQQPITADTNKLVESLEQWSLTIRMLNLQWEDVNWERARGEEQSSPIPSREGVDSNFWYDMGDGTD